MSKATTAEMPGSSCSSAQAIWPYQAAFSPGPRSWAPNSATIIGLSWASPKLWKLRKIWPKSRQSSPARPGAQL
jgi:hypothetical protein